LRPVYDVDVAIHEDGRAVTHVIERSGNCCIDAVTPNLVYSDNLVAGSQRVLVHPSRVCEGSEPNLRDIPTRQTVFNKSTYRVSVAKTFIKIAHVEMRIECNQPDPVEGHVQPKDPRSGDRIVSTHEQRQLMTRADLSYGVPNGLRGLFNGKALDFNVTVVRNRGR
jgi:hypothetical protein